MAEQADEGPVRVLFVCTANICRSAYAEALARHLLAGDPTVEVASAGTLGWTDQPMDAEMAAVLAERSVDPAGHRSRRLTPAMVDEADLVLTAEVAHRAWVLEQRPAAFRRVLTLGQLAATFEDLDPDLRGRDLLDAAARALRPAVPGDDVADPYRRGRAAAEAAADQIETLLGRFLHRLSSRA